MPIRTIVNLGDTRLRKKSHSVKPYQYDGLAGLVKDLRDTMAHHNGVGIAAPQIGVPMSVMIANNLVYVNPHITKVSEDWLLATEGCLSIPDWVADVWRYGAVVVKAQDEKGCSFKIKLDDWEARVVQHEIDHLEGKLIIDVKHENFRKDEPIASPI